MGIEVLKTVPLIQIPFKYTDLSVLLDVYIVEEYLGEVSANEYQELFWHPLKTLNDNDFPKANFGIIRALRFAKVFAVTPECTDERKFLRLFNNVVSRDDIQIIQLRSHALSDSKYIKLAKKCAYLCKKNNTSLILNREVNTIKTIELSGVHMTSNNLMQIRKRPFDSEFIVGASCHNIKEVKKANQLKLDYIFIGPVLEKEGFSKTKILDWHGFANLSRLSVVPAYAIGGMGLEMLDTCTSSGGQGIAAIRTFWK